MKFDFTLDLDQVGNKASPAYRTILELIKGIKHHNDDGEQSVTTIELQKHW